MSCIPSTSRRAAGYPPSRIRTVFERVASMEGVTRLTVGEPDFDTPRHIIDAAVRSLHGGETRYSSNAGIPELRQAIARHYTAAWARPLGVDNVMATVGGMEALLLAMSAVLDLGDQILIPDPAYPNYLGQAHLLGVDVVGYPLTPTAGSG